MEIRNWEGRPRQTHVAAVMRIRWTQAAADDLEHINDYLTEHYPHFAQLTVADGKKRAPKADLYGARSAVLVDINREAV